MGSWRSIALVVSLFAGPALMHAKQLAIVVDTANGTKDVTAGELSRISGGKARSWPDGKPITLIMRDPSLPDMQLLLHRVLNMNPDQVHTFIQAHKASIMIADSDDAVLHFVSSNRGAIGVIDLYSLTKDVNVLKVDGKLPVEHGYLLKGN